MTIKIKLEVDLEEAIVHKTILYSYLYRKVMENIRKITAC